MIEVRNLQKSYTTGSFTQKALDDVSITFRDNEFVAVLGPSGSGKTTLLNILGGLDHADSGDIIINGMSTKDYRDADWDTYRNHHIGFIFQSYNLIPHQSILSNVELALTLAGISKAERSKRAREALERVGLGDHINKKPNQLSGGQAQRVAIARALINDPDIVLADEPTGALDTDTGIAVMDLLSEIAQDRLVIMVTHNPDLANHYATRIVNLADGKITGDSAPIVPGELTVPAGTAAIGATAALDVLAHPEAAGASEEPADSGTAAPSDAAEDSNESATAGGHSPKTGKANMSFLTALSLSFSNLMTKKGRTFLTAFAGSIGIIGIAIILALSNGVNNYIAQIEEETLSSYPITISKSTIDLDSMLGTVSSDDSEGSEDESSTSSSSDAINERTIISDMFATVENNDLSSFKAWLEGDGSYVNDYVNVISYDYGITPYIYTNSIEDPQQLSPSFIEQYTNVSSYSALSSLTSMSSMNSFQEMLDNRELLESQYDVVEGRWPTSYDECVLVLSDDGSISDYTLYSIGVLDPEEFAELYTDAMAGEEFDTPDSSVEFTYEDALNTTFKVILNTDLYNYNADTNTWTDISDDAESLSAVVENGLELKVVGILQANDTTSVATLGEGIAYTSELTAYLIEQTGQSDIVQQQLANPDVDVFTGKTFDELNADTGFDMGSIISFDESALSSLFSTDGLDASSINLDMSTLTSSLDFDGIVQSLSDAPMPEISFDSTQLDATQQAQISQFATTLMVGFLEYYAENHAGQDITAETDLSQDFAAYLAQPDVQANLAQMYQAVGGDASDQVESIMNDYVENTLTPYLQEQISSIFTQAAAQMSEQLMSSLSSSLASSLDPTSLLSGDVASALSDAITINMNEEELSQMLSKMLTSTTQSYENNLDTLGYAELDDPESISIYPIDFDNKELVDDAIEDYNQTQRDAGNEDAVISYSDIMGSMLSSVTEIIDMISMVLIAFVSVSLVVSSIMIGIITYISVLERRKEIGILRAMGASKGNVSSIFIAETVIEGLIAGVFAIVVVLLGSIPVNAIVLQVRGVPNIMILPATAALALICISVLLTFVAGVIPAMNAARRDPVEALRSE